MNYLTRKEVAELLDVSLRTLTNYTAYGLIPAPLQRGRNRLWVDTELYAFMQLPVPVVEPGKIPRRGRGRPTRFKFLGIDDPTLDSASRTL